MSAIIRQQLQLLLPTISTETGYGPDLEALPNEPSSLEVISVTAEKLSRKVARAQALLESWTTILVASAKEVRDEENALFAGFLFGGKSPSDIIAEGYDVQTKLDIKIDRIRNLAAQPPPPTGQTSTSFIRPTINLPALQLPDFDGHEANWPSFWAAFSHTIHDNPSLTGGQKLTYLVGRLRGSARTLVDGFTLTDHNYPIVVDLLKGRYGDDDKRADRLRSELFHLAKPTGHSVSLRNFSENVDRICRQLESLGNNLDNNSFLTVAIKEKLPTDIKAQLYDKEMEEGRAWTSKEWRERLARIVRLKEAIHAPWETPPAPAHSQAPKPLPPRYSEPIRRAFPVVGEIRKINGGRECSLCLRDGHKPSNCAIYQTVQQRINRLAEQGRCSLCAREGHHKDVCPSSARCFRCGGRHHLLVCPSPNNTPARGSNSAPLGFRMPAEKSKAPQANSLAPRPNGAGEHSNPQIAFTIAERDSPTYFNELCPGELQRPTAYLMVKEISVFNNNGHPISVPVFFDPGSQPSFISSDLVSIISPDLLAVENMAVGGFSGNAAPETMRFSSPRFLIRLRRLNGEWEGVELNQTTKIIPPVEFLKEICWHSAKPEKMGVAVKEPKILLGVREFWRFVVGKQEIFPGLFRIETVFGPVFGGEASQPSDSINSVPITCSLSVSGAIVSRKNPEELVKQLWSLESIGISDPLDVNDDSLAIAHFRDSVKFKEGRYEVGWPWRPGGRNRLADNFCLAFSRLSALSRRLLVNPEFREKYQATISDQLERGIIEPADRTGAAEHYIPHQAVVTPKKLRVVYDASAHEKGKPSLNELLFPGPNLVPELAGVLLRFRATAYPVLGDIEKAFLAVGLLEEDREVAKFLWLKDPSQPLTPGNLAIYRFKRIAFGVNSSPFLLASVLQHHLSSVEDSLNMARNFYVDNLLLCNESAEEAVVAVQTARRVMAMAGMRLREFVAPDPSVLSFLPPDEVLVGDVQKVLGIHWNLPEEKLIFELPAAGNFPPTRRGILGTIASLFDPLGCRAVHLEMVDSLSAVDFLDAFRRFVARRGTPRRVWSDNGTQLVLGRQLLRAYYDLPVDWKLIPPHSPWAGGVYERMVGLVKTAFRRSLGKRLATWGQLQTLTHEIEAILNSRPITKPRSAKVLLGNGKEWERSVNQLVPLEGSAEWADVSPPAGKEKEPVESIEGNGKKGDKIRLFPGPQQQRRTEPSANWGRRPTVVGNESGDEDEVSFHFAEPISRNQSPTTSHPSGNRPRERSFRPQSPTGEVGKPRLLTRLGYALSPTLFGPLFVLGVISLVNAGLDVMPITANTEECFVNHGGTECHFDSVTSLTLLPVGQKVELASLFVVFKKVWAGPDLTRLICRQFSVAQGPDHVWGHFVRIWESTSMSPS
uniref:Integrase catalytic domain-containing protein n=1 Tax=Globodera rostochiensis TaxID=31243 RepID=A0A914HTS3_GLORO